MIHSEKLSARPNKHYYAQHKHLYRNNIFDDKKVTTFTNTRIFLMFIFASILVYFVNHIFYPWPVPFIQRILTNNTKHDILNAENG